MTSRERPAFSKGRTVREVSELTWLRAVNRRNVDRMRLTDTLLRILLDRPHGCVCDDCLKEEIESRKEAEQ